MTKWIVLCAGVAIQMILGGIYAWSEFVPTLNTVYGLSKSQCGIIFGATILTFTVVMIPAGRVLQRYGARTTAGIGALLFTLGYVLASMSTGEFWILLLCLSGITGAGIGFGYICPLTVAMKWFPNNKGLVTGVSVAGFGGGAVLVSNVAEHLLVAMSLDVLEAFLYMGLGSGVIAFTSAMFLSQPVVGEQAAKEGGERTSLASILRSSNYLLICLGMFCGTFAGLLVVGNLKPLALSMGLGSGAATLCISIFAVGNATGRITWGQIHDRIGSKRAIAYSLTFLGVSLLPLLLLGNQTAILASVLLIGIGFGACFVVYASSMVELFGVRHFPRLYPICFVGYGVAALIGPGVGGFVADVTGGYAPAILLSAAIVLLAAPLVWLTFQPVARNREAEAHPS